MRVSVKENSMKINQGTYRLGGAVLALFLAALVDIASAKERPFVIADAGCVAPLSNAQANAMSNGLMASQSGDHAKEVYWDNIQLREEIRSARTVQIFTSARSVTAQFLCLDPKLFLFCSRRANTTRRGRMRES